MDSSNMFSFPQLSISAAQTQPVTVDPEISQDLFQSTSLQLGQTNLHGLNFFHNPLERLQIGASVSDNPVTMGSMSQSIEVKRVKPLFRSIDAKTLPSSTTQNSGFNVPSNFTAGGGQHLRSVSELPEKFQSVFKTFPYFNVVQSKVIDDAFYSDKSLVVCAPTGSGKTVIFELAIARLIQSVANRNENFKAVYSPIKALCYERWKDWSEKFQTFGIQCFELTGDTNYNDNYKLRNVNLIFTTPEKWDITTRWRDNRYLVQSIKLFLIDEIHMLNDKTRGATIEAVISRMMTILYNRKLTSNSLGYSGRFVAVSATIPNTEDFAEWFGFGGMTAVCHKMSEDLRPVKLKKVVVGYPCLKHWSEFQFDMSLSYKLMGVINHFSDGKPSLVFCSTRKDVIRTAGILAKEARFILNSQLKQKLITVGNSLRDNKLRDNLISGIGFHHAGLEISDRKIIEELFINGEMPVLIATSTLAMGVNLPAHLVVVKNTVYYNAGQCVEYTDTQILQMIGRAGRPQFDTSATAVIMTSEKLKIKYERFLNGSQVVESSLHKSLAEYLNVEIVMSVITDISVAMQWIRSTFLYIRVMKNPTYYGMPANITKDQVEQKLQELCLRELHTLANANLLQMDEDGFDVKPTEAGRLMARYCLSVDTMKKFQSITGIETIADLLHLLSTATEFSEFQLRMAEKKTLNTLNKDKHLPTIRFPLTGKIRNREMKINCLIQASFGCLNISEWTLLQETTRILRIGQRLSKCLSEIIESRNDYAIVKNCIVMSKCFHAKLWENSKYVSRQLEKIGTTLSNVLVNAGLTTFQKIEDINPRQLELILNRHPPFGNYIRDAVSVLPKFEVSIEQVPRYNSTTAELDVMVKLTNFQDVKVKAGQQVKHRAVLLIGDQDNKVVFKQKFSFETFERSGTWVKRLTVVRASKGQRLLIDLIDEQFVGLDVSITYNPFYSGRKNVAVSRNFNMTENMLEVDQHSSGEEFEAPSGNHTQRTCLVGNDTVWADCSLSEERRRCGHTCHDKETCGHECCKIGVPIKSSTKKRVACKSSKAVENTTTDLCRHQTVNEFFNNVQNKIQSLPKSSNVEHLSVGYKRTGTPIKETKLSFQQFRYKPAAAVKGNIVPVKCLKTSSPEEYWDNFNAFDPCDNLSSRPTSLLNQEAVTTFTHPNFNILPEVSSDDDDKDNDCCVIDDFQDVLMNYQSECEKANSRWLIPEDFQITDVKDRKSSDDYPVIDLTKSDNSPNRRQSCPPCFIWNKTAKLSATTDGNLDAMGDLGMQSSAERHLDFESGRPSPMPTTGHRTEGFVSANTLVDASNKEALKKKSYFQWTSRSPLQKQVAAVRPNSGIPTTVIDADSTAEIYNCAVTATSDAASLPLGTLSQRDNKNGGILSDNVPEAIESFNFIFGNI